MLYKSIEQLIHKFLDEDYYVKRMTATIKVVENYGMIFNNEIYLEKESIDGVNVCLKKAIIICNNDLTDDNMVAGIFDHNRENSMKWILYIGKLHKITGIPRSQLIKNISKRKRFCCTGKYPIKIAKWVKIKRCVFFG